MKSGWQSFAFGQTEWIDRKDLPHILGNILRHRPIRAGTDEDVETRRVILVGHAIDNELRIMYVMGIQATGLANITTYVDTQHLLLETFGTIFSLERILRRIGWRPDQSACNANEATWFTARLHNGGNDAALTLTLMLFLAVTPRSVLHDIYHTHWYSGQRFSSISNLAHIWMCSTQVDPPTSAKALFSAYGTLCQRSDEFEVNNDSETAW